MSAPAPGMFTLPSGQRVWVSPDGRVWTVSGGRVQRCVVAKWTDDGFTVTGNGHYLRAALEQWAQDVEAARGLDGPCPTCGRHVNNLRGHVCQRVKGTAA